MSPATRPVVGDRDRRQRRIEVAGEVEIAIAADDELVRHVDAPAPRFDQRTHGEEAGAVEDRLMAS